jgi:prepilin-type N-terminal cleavage/methylation domain-containing protein
MSATDRYIRRRAGFTLIEIMVAMTILTIIVAIIYASFSSVVYSIEDAQIESERVRARQFLTRSLTANLAQATEGWSPGAAFRTASESVANTETPQEVDQGITRYQFLGTSESGAAGPADSMSFTSSASILGQALPGQVKICTYQIREDSSGDDDRSLDDPPEVMLTITETPVVTTGAGLLGDFTDARGLQDSAQKAAEDFGLEPRTWNIPIHAWDLAFYDGEDWREEWDSQTEGHLPWMVRARVRFEAPEEGRFTSEIELDPEEDPTVLELLFTIPAGIGIYDAPPDYVRPGPRPRAGDVGR